MLTFAAGVAEDPVNRLAATESAPEPSAKDPAVRPLPKFAQMDYNSQGRYAVTPKGTFHLTPTELLLVRTIEEHDGEAVSKANLALRLHRNVTVIGRLLSRLRREGVIESFEVYGEGGAQLANQWRIAPGVRPLERKEKKYR